MSTSVHYPHLEFDAEGIARIGGTRYKVLHLAGEHYHYGWSAEEILRQHPDLRPEQVYAALTYFYDHLDSSLDALKAIANSTDPATAGSLTRAELRKRRSAQGA